MYVHCVSQNCTYSISYTSDLMSNIAEHRLRYQHLNIYYPPLSTHTHTQVEVLKKEEEAVRVALKCREMEILDLGISSASEKQASALQVKSLRNQVEAMRYVLYVLYTPRCPSFLPVSPYLV
jgi:hypothetical protein